MVPAATSRMAAAILCAWTAAASVAAAAGHHHFQSLLELRRNNVVIQHWDLSCGAAALATLLDYQQGERLPEMTIVQAMLHRTDPLKVQHRGGFSWLDLKRFVESRGYSAAGYEDMSLDDVAASAPLIVPIRVFSRLPDSHHFVVLRGIKGSRVVLADPAWGNRTISVSEFERVWFNHSGFVVERRDGRRPPNRLTVQASDAFLLPSDRLGP